MTLTIPIALTADRTIETGLHVTLFSLLRSSSSNLDLYLFLDGYDDQAVARISATLRPFADRYQLNVIPVDRSYFAEYCSLHGNRMMFWRLLLADLLPIDRVIYLDSDLVVNKDIRSLFDVDLGPYVIAASGVGYFKYALEHDFFMSLGLDLGARYFNAGILLLDLWKWRRDRVTDKCLRFARRFPDQVNDQTALNFAFYKDNFLSLDNSFNHAVYPADPPLNTNGVNHIFHFVGSPKPWDFFWRTGPWQSSYF